MKRSKKRVLVTAIGSFSAEHVISVLKKAGHFVAVCDVYPEAWVANSRLGDCFRQAPYCSDEEKYIDFLTEYCRDEKIQFIIPLIDPEIDLLSRKTDFFASQGITVCTISENAAKTVRNKYEFQKLAAEIINDRGASCPVKSIQTYFLNEAPENLLPPVVVKPTFGRSSIGKIMIGDKTKLDDLKSQPDSGEYIVQPYIDGRIVTVDAIRDDFGNCAFSARRELLRTLSGAGTSVETLSDTPVIPFCKNMLEIAGIVGCVNFEFIETPEENGTFTYHVLEINPRFSGGIEFSDMVGGNFVSDFFAIFEAKACGLKYEIKKTSCDRKIIARNYKAYIMN